MLQEATRAAEAREQAAKDELARLAAGGFPEKGPLRRAFYKGPI